MDFADKLCYVDGIVDSEQYIDALHRVSIHRVIPYKDTARQIVYICVVFHTPTRMEVTYLLSVVFGLTNVDTYFLL